MGLKENLSMEKRSSQRKGAEINYAFAYKNGGKSASVGPWCSSHAYEIQPERYHCQPCAFSVLHAVVIYDRTSVQCSSRFKRRGLYPGFVGYAARDFTPRAPIAAVRQHNRPPIPQNTCMYCERSVVDKGSVGPILKLTIPAQYYAGSVRRMQLLALRFQEMKVTIQASLEYKKKTYSSRSKLVKPCIRLIQCAMMFYILLSNAYLT